MYGLGKWIFILSHRGDHLYVLFHEKRVGHWDWSVRECYRWIDFPGYGEAVVGHHWVWVDDEGDWLRAIVRVCGGEFVFEDEGPAEEDRGNCGVGCV